MAYRFRATPTSEQGDLDGVDIVDYFVKGIL